VQVGEGNTQIIYTYNRLTWTDGVAPPPLVSVSGVVDSPYRGLSAFEEQDAAFFFGREAAATEVLERMSRHVQGTGLLVVSGVSGAGKSSLLRAGVLPRIRGAGLASAPGSASWPCLVFTPGRDPLDELALRVAVLAGADAAAVRRGLDTDPEGFALTARQAALTPPPGPAAGPGGSVAEPHDRRRLLLLVVDQFEQVFTQCPDEGQRLAFITALHAAAHATRGPDQAPAALVVLGVRADFEARCADYPQLAGAVQDRYLVTAMTERQLRMAITEPAKTAGSRVEDDLAEVLLADMHARQPGVAGAGVLPLLSHALDQAWRSRTGEALTLADYERTGGIEGAVADSAQRAYQQLTPGQQAAARQVFTRLTATSSDGVDTADRATRSELAEGKDAAGTRDVQAVLEAFAAERLLTLAADSVEISHEVLLTAWPLLRDTWLAETNADRIVRTRLHNTAADWISHSRDPSYLYGGSLLQAADETSARIGADPARYPPFSQTEREFLQASDRAHRRSTRRRQAFIAFLMVLVVGLASATVLAVSAGRQAAHQRDVVVAGQLISHSLTMGDANPAISKLLSIAAWQVSPSNEARYAMLVAATRPGIAVLTGDTGPVVSVAFSKNGKTLASASYDGTVRLWDPATHQQIGQPFRAKYAFTSVAISPDGTILAGGNGDGTVRLWNVATHQPIGQPLTSTSVLTSTGVVETVAFSPDGTILASGSYDGTVRLWDVATHQQIGLLTVHPKVATHQQTGPASHPQVVSSVAFSPDGKTLAIAIFGGTVWLWNLATHQQIGHPLTSNSPVVSIAFSKDGKTLASGSYDGTMRLWNLATHRQIGHPLTAPSSTNAVESVAFSKDGKTLAAGFIDGTVRLWNVSTRLQLGLPLTGSNSPITSVAFSPDGKTLAGGLYNHSIRLWDVATDRQIGNPFISHKGSVNSVAFSPNGKTLATANADHTVRLWDVATGQQEGNPLTGHTGTVTGVAFSGDGKTLASGSYDGTVRVWNVATHQQIGSPLNALAGTVESVAFSRDGKTLASGNDDGTVRLWNVATHQQIGSPLTSRSGKVNSVAFSPNGKMLATGTDNGTVHLWEVATHQQIGSTFGPGGLVAIESVAFSPDGKMLATAGTDHTVRLWDVASHHQIGGPLTGHTGAVDSVAFSKDGTILASSGQDETVRLWDVATHQQIGPPLTGDIRVVWSVAFSPDGKTLASGSTDDTARLWNVAFLVSIVPHLCALEGRSLTPAEWTRYVPPGPGYQEVCP
jgi:WD40 repeat protein